MYCIGFDYYKGNPANIMRDGMKIATTVYRCVMRHTKKCPKKIWIGPDGRCLQHSGEHNHNATPLAVAVRKITVKAKERATANFGTVSVKQSIIESLAGEHRSVIAVVDNQNLTRVLHHARQVNY